MTKNYWREKLQDRCENADCALCQGALPLEENERGIVEFMDGWFWICEKCRQLVGSTLDATQCSHSTDWDIPPYYKRSRKHWLKYLETELQIVLRR